jgi:hypothetical protein
MLKQWMVVGVYTFVALLIIVNVYVWGMAEYDSNIHNTMYDTDCRASMHTLEEDGSCRMLRGV